MSILEKIRKRMKDTEEANAILNAVEFSEVTMQDAIDEAVDEFNTLYAPQSSDTEETIPFFALFFGVCTKLHETAKLVAKRNSIAYNDAGESLDYDGNKDRAYSESLQYFSTLWERRQRNLKAKKNALGFMGSLV